MRKTAAPWEADFLRFQVSELEAADYSTQEADDLARERDRLRNVTDLLQAAAAATSALSSDEGAGALDAVARASAVKLSQQQKK